MHKKLPRKEQNVTYVCDMWRDVLCQLLISHM